MKLGPLTIGVRHLYHGNYDFHTIWFAWRGVDVHSYVGGLPWRKMSARDYLSHVPLVLRSARRIIRDIIKVEQGKKIV